MVASGADAACCAGSGTCGAGWQPFVVMELARLVGQLMPLPLAALRWPQETLERLARMGVRTIGQVLRLPRAGFARRFGTDSLAVLDRLTGRSPDLRERFPCPRALPSPARTYLRAGKSDGPPRGARPSVGGVREVPGVAPVRRHEARMSAAASACRADELCAASCGACSGCSPPHRASR